LRSRLDTEDDLSVIGEARTGPEAISAVERAAADVAIVDMDLPVSDGPRTTALIRERTPRCVVLAVGSTTDPRRLLDALEAGASGYLTKEAPLAELINATRRVRQGQTVVPPTMLGPLLAMLFERKRERDRAFERIVRLTPREREVLGLLAEGADNDEIARVLVISPQTARTHIQNVLGKLSVHSRLEAAAFVARNRLLPDLPVPTS
jgi:DNA-binding NarL/FixJ family response regulator